MSMFAENNQSSNFLIEYIKQNPNCPLEDIINDDELLDILKYNDELIFK